MFGVSKLVGAVNALADNLAALAGTVAEANAGLRGRLSLDVPAAPLETGLLPPLPAQDGPADPAEANGPATNGRARKRAAGAA